MPSPFPGMDPYLEEPSSWKDFHDSMITYLRAAIVPILPQQYRAKIGERVYIVPDKTRTYFPDVMVKKAPAPSVHAGGGRSIVMEKDSDAPLLIPAQLEEEHENIIEIRSVKDESRIVTIIEILSPTNKSTRDEGRENYLAKQREHLWSHVNLLEIDLLRTGRHTVAVPLASLPRKSGWDYLVCLHRAWKKEYEVWPNCLQNRLPRLHIPLDEDAEDIIVDLQAVVNRCYDESGYGIDYTQAPVPPLSEENAAWADALLREQKLRP